MALAAADKGASAVTKLLWKWHRKLKRETGEVYMDRWQLLRTKRLSIYINRINLPDADPLPHTHPWRRSYSLKLWGSYTEEIFYYVHAHEVMSYGLRIPPRWSRIPDMHRIGSLTDGKPCWTLFIGWRADQPWGFVRPDGKLIPHQERKAERGVTSED